MNSDRIEGNWKQVKGKVKARWGKLTDDHLDVIDGRREQLAGRIQEAYGVSKDEVDRQIKDWEGTLDEVEAEERRETRGAAPHGDIRR